MKYIKQFVKSETVLTAALVLAVVSCFLVPPDAGYLAYIDTRTLTLLFCLMAVMAGLRGQGVFFTLGRLLLGKTKGLGQVVPVLVLLCFFGSMLITNDVALLTFVPFTFAVLSMLGGETRQKWVLPVVCMQTIAANLGSMLTPIGNPQNLYLYGKSGLSLPGFMALMLPYSLLSLALLLAWSLWLCRGQGRENTLPVTWQAPTVPPDRRKIALYVVLFCLCLFTVAHILPYGALFVIVLLTVILCDKSALAGVDYALLATFTGFFVFIGNIGRLPVFSAWLQAALAGREVGIAVLASQIISNVPAALLLSGFTGNTAALIVGTNLGGLGTLIASMASLISFRQIASEEGERKSKYFLLFTISNLVFLAALLALYFLLGLV